MKNTSEGWQGSTVSATFQIESCRRNVRLGPNHTFPAGSIPSRDLLSPGLVARRYAGELTAVMGCDSSAGESRRP